MNWGEFKKHCESIGATDDMPVLNGFSQIVDEPSIDSARLSILGYPKSNKVFLLDRNDYSGLGEQYLKERVNVLVIDFEG